MLKFNLLLAGFIAGILSLGSLYAHCPRCVKIESDRAREQAEKGPQPVEYYDEISLTTPEDRSTSASPSAGSEMKETKLHATPNSSTDRTYQNSSNTHSLMNGQREDSKTERFSEKNKGLAGAPTESTEIREYSYEEVVPLNGNSQALNTLKNSSATYSTIAVIFQSPEFIQTLNGPFTLFVPSNDAFRKLPPGTLQNLLRPENRNQLTNLVRSHLVARKLSADDRVQGLKVTTLNGKPLIIEEKNGQISVNEAHVLKVETLNSDKVIYIIDRVLL